MKKRLLQENYTPQDRNDQISLDTRMFVKDACIEINNLIKNFQRLLLI